jgi:hypothetical protein
MRIERAPTSDTAKHIEDTDLSMALSRWNETVVRPAPESSRTALLSQIAAEVQSVNRN